MRLARVASLAFFLTLFCFLDFIQSSNVLLDLTEDNGSCFKLITIFVVALACVMPRNHFQHRHYHHHRCNHCCHAIIQQFEPSFRVSCHYVKAVKFLRSIIICLQLGLSHRLGSTNNLGTKVLSMFLTTSTLKQSIGNSRTEKHTDTETQSIDRGIGTDLSAIRCDFRYKFAAFPTKSLHLSRSHYIASVTFAEFAKYLTFVRRPIYSCRYNHSLC